MRPLCWRVVRRSRAGARLRQRQEAGWFIGFATAGAVAYAAALPLLQLYRIAGAPIDPGRAGWAAAVTVACLPVQAWLVWSAARDLVGRAQRWALGALAAVLAVAVPLAGVDLLGALYVPAALMLVVLRPPWSPAAFAALAAAPVLVALATGRPQWASYFTLGVPVAAVPLAVVLGLLRAARRLRAARSALAEQAVIAERLRIDGELRRTVAAALEAIATGVDRAGVLAAADPPAAAGELNALADAARQTLAEARRMVTRYQQGSVRGELEAAATLLAAAGIRARLVLPPDGPPEALDQAARSTLQRDLARLLAAAPAVPAATITLARRHGRVQVELGPDDADPAASEVPAG
jgi:two-component system, NarL family, sensor histidine kinase DesK